MTGQPLLELKDVRINYGGIEAVKGVSFRVDEGEIVTLIGSNGAGKTTTLKAISGLKRLAEGAIVFQSERVDDLPAHEITELGIGQVPEGRRIFPRMTVRENLDMGAYGRRDGRGIREDFERVFTLFPVLKQRIKQVAGTLSGGEQQMLAIGRTLMSRPQLLMLDEPSLGLSPILVERIFELLGEIHQQGMSILLVEQNAQKALTLADRGYVLESGTMVLEDSASRLLGNDQVRRAYLGEE
jgi:branched-chain amino acid transport system ATP-binding protein